ncbi:FtsK/SpoIIIE domain-containing protein [Longispora sp. NPDC051575]|uniref:FtsK/SpoIIIE domain-containing protein n=1 Tax=Longispora sp. NPDC051575 TaxID=3154943 RepID=UPI003435EF6F
MNLTVTSVDHADGSRRDHLVEVPLGCTVAELSAALGREREPDSQLRAYLGPGQARPLYLGGTALAPERPVAGSGIRAGSVLGLGGPAGPAAAPARSGPPVPAPVLVELHLVSGPDAGRTWQLTAGSHEVGAGPGCAIRLEGEDTPARGLWVTVAASGAVSWRRDPGAEGLVRAAVVTPPDGTRESSADGQGTAWPEGTDVAVGAGLLRVVAPVEADAAVTESADGLSRDYNRPPRIAPHLEAERIRLPTPPTRSSRAPFPLLMLFAPVILGLVMVGVFRSYFYLVFILFTPVMAVSNWVVGRRTNRRQHEEAARRYQEKLETLHRQIRGDVEHEREVRSLTGPDPATVGLIATGPGGKLWQRRRRDADHLLLRLGTVDLPSVTEVDDPARDDNHRTVRWTVPDVPVGLELPEYGVIGLAGPDEAVLALARWLLAQAAVLHSPRDLRVVLLTDPSRAAEWDWARWLPHLRAAGSTGPVVSVGNDPETVAQRVNELVAQLQARDRVLGSSMGRAMFTDPDILVIADGARHLRDVPGMVQVFADGPRVRIFSVCLDQQERLLPEECAAVVAVGESTLTLRRGGTPELPDIRADLVGAGWCEEVARALAPLRDVSPEHEVGLPGEVRLLDLLDQEPPDADRLLARWRRQPASTTFLLGTGYDGPLALDLVRDGPHGLVAGTTGSGKSELLQAFIASLAATNRPDELTFVLVDYKGGSAFRECEALPHTLGMVTDLDAHLVGRAMDSLGAELRRRERILADAEVKDLAAYRARRGAEPDLPRLPRLLLVIDEFATLVREVPDFVPGLISIAQRGRSLGLHLVLATQRPAGSVTPDIKANTNLRIALRVTDAVESQDIIDTAEAVHISPGTPGRAFVRYGHRNAVPFQSAWVGAERPVADGDAPVRRLAARSVELSWNRLGRPVDLPAAEAEPGPAGPVVPTDLQALVAAIGEAAGRLDDLAPQPSPWLPALDDRVLLAELPDVARPGDAHPSLPALIPYALEDVPELQQRRVATVDLATFGHLYVIGAPRSGRTQVLRTIAGSAAARAKADDVHMYAIDAAGGGLAALESLPHCGAVVSRHDMERMDRLLRRLSLELTRRQEACTVAHCADLVELRQLLPPAERPPHLLLFVDGWDALAPVLDEYDHGRLLTDVTRLAREGAAMGLHLIATSERALLGGRLSAHNDHKLLLRQTDRNDYQLVGLMPSKVPANIANGRGWHVLSRTETQVALLDADDSGRAQAEALRRIGNRATPGRRRPFPVAGLPNLVEFTDVYERVPAELRRPLWGLLGVGDDDGAPLGVDLATTSAFFVGGASGTGRSNTLACLAVSLLAGGTGLVVLTPRDSPLRGLGQHERVRLLADPDPSADAVRAALDALPGPRVVLIDDADLLGQPAADKVLRDVVAAGRDNGEALVYAGPLDALSIALGSWVSAARRVRRGVLLNPRATTEGDVIGARLSASQVRATMPAGRGYTGGAGGAAMAVQIPRTTLRS